MTAFVYPNRPHSRRHGPKGYARHDGYRAWLRDDFTFRCVYCLTREQWGKGQHDFSVDHLIPLARAPNRALDYDNLVYSCLTCNSLKNDVEGVSDPRELAFGNLVKVADNGKIEALDDTGQFLIDVLRLDNRENTEYRCLWLSIIRLAQFQNRELYFRLMGFPKHLPNLARKRPPAGNSRPEGVQQGFFAQRQQGRLPQTY